MEPITIILTILVSLVSGLVGGMVGGSYLILIPGLLFLGMDIHHVIGITKLTTIAAGLVFINYWRHGKVDLKFTWPYAVLIAIGSIIGSFIVIGMAQDILQRTIGIFMIIIALFILFNKNFGINPIKIGLKRKHIIIAMVLFFILGIYLGFYAAASSIFAIIIFTSLLKKNFVESIGNARLLDFSGGLVAAVIFAAKGLIDYKFAIPIALFYFGGAWAGSHITLKKGAAWVRYLLIVIAVASAIKLLFF